VSDQISGDSRQSGPFFRLAQRCFLFLARLWRGMTLGVRAMVLDDKGQVLLVRHSYVKGWHMPGGGVEAGETLEQALAKELQEEANIQLTGSVSLVGVFLNTAAFSRDHIAVYVVRHFEQTGPKLPDREILEARFFPLNDLPHGTTLATRRHIEEVSQGKTISQHW
jgi:ADP-ribose pyrophosphatase YjhB (NUDIX family)